MGNLEARRQAKIVSWIRTSVPNVICFSVPNDGFYTKSEAAKRKWTGVLAGVPDLAVVYASGVAFLEVKAPGEKPTEVQIDMMAQLDALGARCAVVRSVEDVQEVLAAWGLTRPAAGQVAA